MKMRQYDYSRPVFHMNENKYEKAVGFDGLYKGLKKSCNNVRWKDSVVKYEWHALTNTYELMLDLQNDKYKIKKYKRFTIYEPKKREIVATGIRDRQFQRSLCDNVLYDEITKSFIYDNCACQKGKGVDFALNRMDTHLHRFYRKHGCDGWVLKCDIKHYFAETSHDVAKAAMRKRLKEDDIYEYVAMIIDSFDGDKGIGLGSQVSQLVQLAVLDDTDHWIKEDLQVKQYIRYMDDFILIHEDKDFLVTVLNLLKEKLAEIGLELNDKTSLHPLKQGVMFLKWHFYLTDTGKVIRKMSKSTVTNWRRKIKKIARRIIENGGDEQDLTNSHNSRKANALRGNMDAVVRRMDILYMQLLKEIRLYIAGMQNYLNERVVVVV